MGRGELLRDDLISWRKNGVSVLMAVGKHAERLRDSLADIGIDLPVKESLDRDVASGEQLILGEALPKGFEYPELKLAVLTEYEIYGTEARAAGKQRKKRASMAFSELEP